MNGEDQQSKPPVAEPIYEYVSAPGYESRNTVGGQRGPGRPAWTAMDPNEAMGIVRRHHDAVGGPKALLALEELRCGEVIVRRCRKRVRAKGRRKGEDVDDAPLEDAPADG